MSWLAGNFIVAFVLFCAAIALIAAVTGLIKYWIHKSVCPTIAALAGLCVIPCTRWILGYDLFVPERGFWLLVQLLFMLLFAVSCWYEQSGEEGD